MYEDLTFDGTAEATRVWTNTGETETLDDATVERESSRTAEQLHIHNIGEGGDDVRLTLIDGELHVDTSLHGATFGVDDYSVTVSDDVLTLTIEHSRSVTTVDIPCEGDVNDDDGPDLERFGIDL